MTNLIIFLCLLILVLISNFFLLRGTFFEFSFKNRSYFSLFLGREIYLLIIPGVFMFVFGFEYVPYKIYVTESSVITTAYFIFYSLIVFLVTLAILARTFGSSFSPKYDLKKVTEQDYLVFKKIIISALVLITVIYVFMLVMGVRHAFMNSLFFGYDLMELRISNSNAAFPSVVSSLFKYLIFIYALTLGFVFSKLSLILKVCLLFLLVYFSSYYGSKGPIFINLILFYVALIHDQQYRWNFTLFIRTLLGFNILVALTYFVVKVQYPFTDPAIFMQYILNRVFVAQIHGVFEQFSLQLMRPEYIFNSLPFGQMFTDEFTLFSKDLILATLSYGKESNETGVMNSFFIGEALAIGGYMLVYLSPVIAAVNYFSIVLVLNMFFRRLFKLSRFSARYFLQIFVPSYVFLTADFNGIFLFKLLLMLAIFSLILFSCYLALSGLFYKSKGLKCSTIKYY